MDKQITKVPTSASHLPEMPPIINTMVATAPNELKSATALACLAPLGVVGCKLSARYINGEMHSPLFQTAIVGPQASGKGHLNKIISILMSPVSKIDEEQEKRLQDYDSRMSDMKAIGYSKNEILATLGLRSKAMVRDLGAKISTTAMMELTHNNKGLAMILRSEEAHSLVKSWTSRNTDISDMLRIGWDKGHYRQNMASKSGTFSGKVQLQIATSICGTPGAFAQLLPSEESGAVGRILFVGVTDDINRPMPVWQELSEEQTADLESRLNQLNNISIAQTEAGLEPQPEHIMDLGYARDHIMQWFGRQLIFAAQSNSYSRRTFIKRDAVIGFRAAILAHYLWGEPTDQETRDKVCRFAEWVADKALVGHLGRYMVAEDREDNFFARKIYDSLNDTFTSGDMGYLLNLYGMRSTVKDVICKWKRDNRVAFTGETLRTVLGPRRVYRKIKELDQATESAA